MADPTHTVSISFAWWVRCFLWGTVLLSHATGWAPSEERITAVCRRGMRVRSRRG